MKPNVSKKRLISLTAAVSTLAVLVQLRGSQANPANPFEAGNPTYETTAPKGTQSNDGDNGVSTERGAATYSFPFAIPPGRLGMAPSVALTYSSQGALRGGVAAGWSMDLPSIRLEKLRTTYSDATTMKYRASMGAGGYLVSALGDPVSYGGTAYRLETDDAFVRFERIGTGSSRWVARTPDGMRYFFDATPGASDGLTVWNLTRQVDPRGNEIQYTWGAPPADSPSRWGWHRLDQIDYTVNNGDVAVGTAPTARVAHAKVVFSHAAAEFCPGSEIPIGASLEYVRGDSPGTISGTIFGAQRLTQVQTFVRDAQSGAAAWREVRRYALGYDTTALSCTAAQGAPLRYLTSIGQTGFAPSGTPGVAGAATTVPPITFAYGTTALSHTAAATHPSAPAYPETGDHKGAASTLMDMNGDGLQDIAWVEKTAAGCEMRLHKGLPGGGFSSATDSLSLPSAGWSGYEKERCDLNGQVTYKANWTNGGAGACTAVTKPAATISYHFLDYDSDGLVDLLTNVWADESRFNAAIEFDDLSLMPAGTIDCPLDVAQDPEAILRPARSGCGTTSCTCGWSIGLVGNGTDPPDPYGSVATICACDVPNCRTVHYEAIGRYRWRVYRNLGGTFVNPKGYTFDKIFVESPLPLPPSGDRLGDINYGVKPLVSVPSLADLNGDGFLDYVDPGNWGFGTSTYGAGWGTTDHWRVWLGDGKGHFATSFTAWPIPEVSPAGATPFGSGVNTGNPNDPPEHWQTYLAVDLRDMNGDGLPDLLLRTLDTGTTSRIFFYPNTGAGFSTTGIDTGVDAPLAITQVDTSLWGGYDTTSNPDVPVHMMLQGKRGDVRRLFDVDDDGLTDLLYLPASGVDVAVATGSAQVAYNVGDTFLPFQNLPAAWYRANRLIPYDGTWWVKQDVTDVTGDGLADLVAWSAPLDIGYPVGMDVISPDLTQGAPRLLKTVNNGVGATVSYSYAPSTDPSVVTMGNGRMPNPMWVVKRVDTDPGFGQPVMSAAYTYAGPVYGSDSPGRPQSFLGFSQASVETAAPSGSTDGGTYVVSDYDYALDARGREVQVRTYAKNGATTSLRAAVKTTWVAEPLLGTGLSAPARFIHRSVVETCTATSGDPNCTLVNSPVNRRLTETWLVQVNSAAGPLLYALRQEDENAANTPIAYRRTIHVYTEHYDTGAAYRLLPTSVQGQENVAGTFTVLSQEDTHYDSLDQPDKTTTTLNATEFADVVRTFDGWGNVATVKKPHQVFVGSLARTTYFYDVHGVNPYTVTNEKGHVVTTTTDFGTGVATRTYGPNYKEIVPDGCVPSCRPVRVWDQEDWTIDGFGRVLTHAVDIDHKTLGYASYVVDRFAYTDSLTSNQVKAEHLRDLGGATWKTTEHNYDGRGRTISDTERRFVAGQPDAVTSYDYDGAGLLWRTRSPNPTVDTGALVDHTFSHDAIGRVTRFLQPDGSGVTVAYSNGGFDKTVTELTPTDGTGATTFGRNDLYGRLYQVQEYDNPSAGQVAVTNYEYDAADRLRQVTDADGAVTKLTHDYAGRRVQIQRVAVAGTRTWKYTYNRNGNLVTEEAPAPTGLEANYRTQTSYDDLDRIAARTPGHRELAGAGYAARRAELGIGPVSYTYDGDTKFYGELTGVTLPWGGISYEYEARHLVSKERRWFTVGYLASAAGDQTIRRTYNALALPTYTWFEEGAPPATVSTGIQSRTTYDARGLVQAVQWYDPAAATWKDVANYTRSLAGAPLSRATSYNQTRQWTYDVLGRPRTDLVSLSGATKLDRAYTFTESGDLKSVSGRTWSGTTYVPADASFTYDKTHRVRTATGPSGYSMTMAPYSKAGNVMSVNLAGPSARNVSYTYGARDPQAVDRLTNVTGLMTTYASFGYDLSGNTTTRTITGGTASTYTWDGDDQLREASVSGTKEAYYYDHAGQRVLAMNGTDGARFWFGESETQWPVGGGAATRTVYLGDSGGTLARLKRVGTATVTLEELEYSDALQNLVLSLGPTGTVTSWFHYGAFGEVIASGEAAGTKHRRQFNGKENDAKTGLRYYGARYYDPLTLRWTSGDPLYRFTPEMGLTQPNRQNLYAFSLNNPLSYLDPDGRLPGVPAAAAAALPAAAAAGRAAGVACAKSPTCRRIALWVGKKVAQHGKKVVEKLGENVKDIFMVPLVFPIGDAIPEPIDATITNSSDGTYYDNTPLEAPTLDIEMFPSDAAVAATPAPIASSAGKMQKEVERGQAPSSVERVDKAHPPEDPQDHAHLKDGTRARQDGTTKPEGANVPNAAIKWFRSHGWNY